MTSKRITGPTMKSIVYLTVLIVLMVTGAFFVHTGFTKESPAEPAPTPTKLFEATDVDTVTVQPDTEALKTMSTMETINGPVVTVPSLDLVSPMMETGSDNGELVLPDPPYSTRYDQTKPVGSDSGSTIVSSHVDYGYGRDVAPFGRLHKVDKGATVFVRNEDNDIYAYRVSEIDLYYRTEIPKEMFRLNGDPLLYLVTCSGEVINGDDLPYYENNMVVTTSLIGKVNKNGEIVNSDGIVLSSDTEKLSGSNTPNVPASNTRNFRK